MSVIGAASTDHQKHLRRYPMKLKDETLCGKRITRRSLPDDAPKCVECRDIGADILTGAR